MSDVIQKYVKLGVLNYIDHETPRHYFLWADVMEEQPSYVHCVVEELCDENIAMQHRIRDLEDQVNWYRDRVVWGFYEEETPKFYQGKAGEHEICEPVDAEQVTRYLKALDIYEARLAKAVELAEKSIKWLRLYGADVHREAATLAEIGGKDE